MYTPFRSGAPEGCGGWPWTAGDPGSIGLQSEARRSLSDSDDV